MAGTLHYGNFGGPLSRILWAFLGVGCCLLTVTGTLVWSERRRESQEAERRAAQSASLAPPAASPWPERMRRVLAGMTAGLPLGTFAAVLSWAVALEVGVAAIRAMGLAAAASLLLAVVFALRAASLRRTVQRLLVVSGALAVALPAAVGLATGASTLQAWRAGQPAPLAVDLALLLLGAGILQVARRLGRPRAPAPDRAEQLAVGDRLAGEGGAP